MADARRSLAAEFRDAGLETPELDARLLVGHALGLDHTGLAAQAHRRLAADGSSATSPRWRRAGSRASRSRASSAARNSGGCRCGSTPRRWCRGRRPKRWSRRRSRARSAVATRALAHRRSRHRLGRAPARAAVRTAGSLRHRHRSQRRRARLRARQCGGARPWRRALRSSPATTAAALARPVRSRGVQSALCRARSDIAALAPEVRDFDPRRALDGGIGWA